MQKQLNTFDIETMKNTNKNYSLTKVASYIGYVVQAITINFTPLLFVTFMGEFGIGLGEVSALVALTFIIQFTVDFLSVFLIRHINYRALTCTAHALSCTGLVLMAQLPYMIDPFIGLCVAVAVYSSGSGIIEVVISPIIESCPSRNKAAQMSLLHSFYCWGQVGCVALSTLFFVIFSPGAWRVMAMLWAAVPLVNFFLFMFCPLDMTEQTEKSAGIRSLFGRADFLLIMLMILCSGAAEIAVSQWASAYCETALGVSKTVGDIAGPMAFAVCMGISRLGYSLFGEKVKLERFILKSGLLCVAGYAIIAFSPFAWMGLGGFAVCGFSVGILWPGAFSLASKHVDGGSTMFALLSFSGDAGCTLGPAVAGVCASFMSDDIGAGISCAAVFPILLCISSALLIFRISKKTQKAQDTP